MPEQDFDQLFGALSQTGRNALLSLQSLAQDVYDAVATSPAGPVEWSAGFLDLLDSIESTAIDPDIAGHGPDVAPEDASQTGILMRTDGAGETLKITLRQALDSMSSGDPVLIGGAGESIGAFVDDAAEVAHTTHSKSVVLQYVGLDASHWKLPEAAAKLEVNLVKTAVLELVSSALNANHVPSLVISYSFGAWVVNRALQALPPQVMAFARNIQIDGFGPLDAMSELVAAKMGPFGKICSVQTVWAAKSVAPGFGAGAEALKKLPVDIHV